MEKHGSCIGSMFVHKEKHAFNSMCEVENAAMNNVKNHLPSHLTQVRITFLLKAKSIIRIHIYFFKIRSLKKMKEVGLHPEIQWTEILLRN